MHIKNTYSIITKKYPLRLSIARKGLIQLFLQKDFDNQLKDSILFSSIELINITYTNIWFALEGFIDVIHTMLGLEGSDEKEEPKELATKLSEVKGAINKPNPKAINYRDHGNIKCYCLDIQSLNRNIKLISIEINNSNEFKSKKKRNFMNHLPIKEGAHFSEFHISLIDSEKAKHRFYASDIIDTHTIYGLNYEAVKRLYDLFDNFIMHFVSFIKKHINSYNLSLYECTHHDSEAVLLKLSILNCLLYSQYDEENILCSGGQELR